MRILHIASPFVKIPPPEYGGAERVIEALGRSQIELGHEVTVFSVGTSRPPGRLRFHYEKPVLKWDFVDEFVQVSRALESASEFDVVHNHASMGPALAGLSPTPMVTTLHNYADQQGRIDRVPRIFPRANYVAVSANQRRVARALDVLEVIPNPIPAEVWDAEPRTEPSDGSLLFMGRVSEIKGTHLAIAVARASCRPLTIAGPVHEDDGEYFEEMIAPHLDDPLINYVGEVGGRQKLDLYRTAGALVAPLLWEEPFGLVLVEAPALGTPVLAFRAGAAAEVIEPDVTGQVSSSVAEMAEQVDDVLRLDRRRCAAAARTAFGPTTIAERYLATYSRLIVGSTAVA